MDASGGSVRRLTTHLSADTSPTWSPDGTRLAFASDRAKPGVPDIYIMDANQEIIRLTEDPTGATQPAWSPDGNWIAYVSRRDGNANIYRREVTSDRIDRLTEHPGEDTDPSWSPDGNWIAFTSDRDGNPEIYLLDLLALAPFRVTTDDEPDYYPVWHTPPTAHSVEIPSCCDRCAQRRAPARRPRRDRGIIGRSRLEAAPGAWLVEDDDNNSLWWEIELRDIERAWLPNDMVATGTCASRTSRRRRFITSRPRRQRTRCVRVTPNAAAARPVEFRCQHAARRARRARPIRACRRRHSTDQDTGAADEHAATDQYTATNYAGAADRGANRPATTAPPPTEERRIRPTGTPPPTEEPTDRRRPNHHRRQRSQQNHRRKSRRRYYRGGGSTTTPCQAHRLPPPPPPGPPPPRRRTMASAGIRSRPGRGPGGMVQTRPGGR